MLTFGVKVNLKNGAESYEAWRGGEHDDLVLATALVCWYAQLHDHKEPVRMGTPEPPYDPLRWGLE